MTQPFLGQIQMFGFNFAPRGWAMCNGQTLSIQQNAALFALLGVQFGGNGTSTFQLPDLRGRVPLSQSPNYVIGQMAGSENVTITAATMPQHQHVFSGTSGNANQDAPDANGAVPGTIVNIRGGGAQPDNRYGPSTTPQALFGQSLSQAGQSQPHSNIQPYLTITVCIALTGIFPSRN